MLLGMVSVAVIGFIAIVAGWITTQWSNLAGGI
jgi:Flp pilus assembly pilin Flp